MNRMDGDNERQGRNGRDRDDDERQGREGDDNNSRR